MTFSGHATINVSTGENVQSRLFCNMPNGGVMLYDQTGLAAPSANVSFACTSLQFASINFDDEEHFVTISGVIQYQASTDVSSELP